MTPSDSWGRLSPTSYVVLGMIALRGPSTPYDLKRAVGHSIGYFWPFPHAQLYSEPKRLTEAGLLALTSENGGRRRLVYDITEAGRAAVSAWLAEPTNDQMQVRDMAEMKLFFSEMAQPEDMRALADQQVEQHRQRIAVYESMMTRFGHRPEYAGRVISLRLGLRIEYAALEFWTGYAAETRAGTTAEGDRQLRPSLWMPTEEAAGVARVLVDRPRDRLSLLGASAPGRAARRSPPGRRASARPRGRPHCGRR